MAILTTTNQGLNFIGGTTFIQTGTNTLMSIETGGNVGIGATSPNAKLQIDNQGEGEFAGPNSSAAGSSHILLADVGGTTRTLMSGPSIVFRTPANADGTNIWATSRLLGSPAAAGSARGTFSIQVRDNYDPFNDGTSWNWRTALTAINTGNVGIGTNSPGAKLEVNGQIIINSTALGGQDAFSIYNSTNQLFHIQNSSSNDEASLLLGANNVIKVKLDTAGDSYLNGGNVGIGMTNPGYKLDVSGGSAVGARISTTGFTNLDLVSNRTSGNLGGLRFKQDIDAAQTGEFLGLHGGGFDWKVGDGSVAPGIKMRLDSSGKLGIGTTSPNARLNVNGGIKIEGTNSLSFGGTASIPAWGINSSGNDLIINDQATTVGDVLFTNARNVGIGVTSADAKLEVAQNAGGAGLNIINGGETAFRFSTRVEDTTVNTVVFRQGIYHNNTENATIAFYRGGSSVGGFMTFQTQNGNERMRISAGGNVGIATTNPRDKLDVVGIGYINNLRVGFTGSPSPATSLFGTRGTFYNNAFQTNYMMHCVSSATNLGFTRGPSNSNPLTFNAGDRTGATNAIGSITLTSAGTSYNTTSDYRLKENEEKISNAIDRLKNLKPIRFNWISEPEEEKVDGFLAHEVAEVVPEAVTGEKDAIDYKGDDDLQMLENSKLVPLLTAALQQAIDKIELLEQRIQSIENK